MAETKLSFAEISFLKSILKTLEEGANVSEEEAKETKRLLKKQASAVIRQGIKKHANLKKVQGVHLATTKTATAPKIKTTSQEFVHRPNAKNRGPQSVKDTSAADKINRIKYRNRFIERLEEGFKAPNEWLMVYSEAVAKALGILSKTIIYKVVNSLGLEHVYYDSEWSGTIDWTKPYNVYYEFTHAAGLPYMTEEEAKEADEGKVWTDEYQTSSQRKHDQTMIDKWSNMAFGHRDIV